MCVLQGEVVDFAADVDKCDWNLGIHEMPSEIGRDWAARKSMRSGYSFVRNFVNITIHYRWCFCRGRIYLKISLIFNVSLGIVVVRFNKSIRFVIMAF